MASEVRRKKILVVGGGASGLLAAITAAGSGASVTVLEQNEKPGKKLNATGNGRCNLTNLQTRPDAYRGCHPEFVRSAFSQFSVQDTLRFFTEIGVSPISKDGYIYPRSLQASAVTNLLLLKANSLGIKVKTNEKVLAIARSEKSNPVDPDAPFGWLVKTEGWQYEADAVILATGSKASAIAGSDGSGYALAESLGHRVLPPFPALCALRLEGNPKFFSGWSGVRAEGTVTVSIDQGKKTYQETGELQLTEYGISGIPVFQISRYAIQALQEHKSAVISVDFLPEIPDQELEAFFHTRLANAPYQNVKRGEQLLGLFPEKLVKVLCTGKDLSQAVKHLTFPIKGGMDFKQAQVCGGGVDTSQVNADTMGSRIQKDIYFTGELLDIDGICGGYNLQWAWSSGYVAGLHAANTDFI